MENYLVSFGLPVHSSNKGKETYILYNKAKDKTPPEAWNRRKHHNIKVYFDIWIKKYK